MNSQDLKSDYNELFFSTYDEVMIDPNRFFGIFLGKFLSYPDVQNLFENIDIMTLNITMHRAFVIMVEYAKTHVTSRELIELARHHRMKKVSAEYYEHFRDALIEALKEYCSEFTEAHVEAWRIMLTPSIAVLRQNALNQTEQSANKSEPAPKIQQLG